MVFKPLCKIPCVNLSKLIIINSNSNMNINSLWQFQRRLYADIKKYKCGGSGLEMILDKSKEGKDTTEDATKTNNLTTSTNNTTSTADDVVVKEICTPHTTTHTTKSGDKITITDINPHNINSLDLEKVDLTPTNQQKHTPAQFCTPSELALRSQKSLADNVNQLKLKTEIKLEESQSDNEFKEASKATETKIQSIDAIAGVLPPLTTTVTSKNTPLKTKGETMVTAATAENIKYVPKKGTGTTTSTTGDVITTTDSHKLSSSTANETEDGDVSIRVKSTPKKMLKNCTRPANFVEDDPKLDLKEKSTHVKEKDNEDGILKKFLKFIISKL